jgi:hypothetical protein
MAQGSDNGHKSITPASAIPPLHLFASPRFMDRRSRPPSIILGDDLDLLLNPDQDPATPSRKSNNSGTDVSRDLLGATSPQHEASSGSGPPSPSLLHPHSYSPGLRPPAPTFKYSMPDESSHDGEFPSQAAAAAGAPVAASPFNFQTQFISTTPVKSVCFLPLPFVSLVVPPLQLGLTGLPKTRT